MIKKLMIILTVIVLAAVNLLMLSGCPKETEGFEGGFTRAADDPKTEGIMVAVKSDKSVFDMDDITIDLYYGTTIPEFPIELDERYEPVCVAVYYQKLWGGGEVLFDDYKNSGRFQIIREISVEDFYGGGYAVTREFEDKFFFGIYRYTFIYNEKFTIPSEYFVYSEGYFYISVSAVYFDKEDEKYFFSDTINGNYDFNKTDGGIRIGYRLLEDGKIIIL